LQTCLANVLQLSQGVSDTVTCFTQSAEAQSVQSARLRARRSGDAPAHGVIILLRQTAMKATNYLLNHHRPKGEIATRRRAKIRF